MRLTSLLLDEPWAMPRPRLETLANQLTGVSLAAAFDLEATGPPSPTLRGSARGGVVAVLPVHGVLVHRASPLTALFGGTSTEQLARAFDDLVTDQEVAAIVLDIDSPGGSVSGITEFAQKIRGGRERKPVVAVANTLATSAAYWLGSQAAEFVASPSARVGSIGTYMVHRDVSVALDRAGLRHTFVEAGRFKTEATALKPLSSEARHHVQSLVDAAFGLMVADIAAGRRRARSDVRGEQFGEGRVFDPKAALQRRMIDRIATLDQTLGLLSSAKGRSGVLASTLAAATVEYMQDPLAGLDGTALAAAVDRKLRSRK